MKKFLTILASSLLAVIILALCGCAENGVIPGNYKEPTKNEFVNAFDGIDFDSVLGEKYGLQILSEFEGSYSADKTSLDYKINTDYKVAANSDGTRGAGTSDITYSMTENRTKISGEYTAKLYNDDDYFYSSIDGVSNDLTNYILKLLGINIGLDTSDGVSNDLTNYKININEFMEYLMASSGVSGLYDLGLTESVSYSELYDILKLLGVGIGLDTSDGVKVKFSITENTAWTILLSDYTQSEISLMKQAVKFNTFKYDVYASFDKKGNFSQFSMDVDIDVKVDNSKIDPSNKQIVSEKIKGYVSVKTYDGAVSIPNNIATDESYQDITDLIIGGDNDIV